MDKRYETIDTSHGEGGFGKISKYRDVVLERMIAVKQLRFVNSNTDRERFLREAKALARMSHPNIPAIYDIDFDDNSMRILFEFVEGKTLRQLISEKIYPPMTKVRRWFTQVAAALNHAHSKGIIHRDIKPENIIISSDEENAILVDFGIAISSSDSKRLTDAGYAIGTPAYMSPEQAKGEALDSRTDIYSLGITMYETLSGILPHPGAYQKISDQNEAIPPAIDALIQDCLVSDLNSRVPNTIEFIKRLRSAFRTDIPFSALLTDARLHELVGAIRQLSPEDFNAKPRGQKLLLMNRLKDLARVNRPELQLPTAELIALLVRLARLESPSDYAPICSTAYDWGFEKFYGPSWQGDQDIRDSIIESAKSVNASAHLILSEHFLTHFEPKSLTALPKWYTHDLRILVTALLANPNCGPIADRLAVFYDNLNAASH